MVNGGPFVSVIIPCRNEENFIAGCLDSVIANDYPAGRLEILVVDGMSTDRTPAILSNYAKNRENLRVLNNPRKITPVSLNIGARNASGELIMRMDAHAKISNDYIRRCVETSLASGADNVGGVMKTLPQSDGIFAQTVAECLSHRFGVGGSAFRTGASRRVEVDTVFGGCYRREVFERVGYWNEDIPRSQDIEFNRRLKRAGGRIILDPEIVSYYYVRSDPKTFLKHNWTNGVWAILPFLYCDAPPVSWRHLVPLAFISALGAACALATVTHIGTWLLCGIVAVYAAACLGASVAIAVQKKRLRLAVFSPIVFAMLHLTYGLGSVWGLIRIGVHLLCFSWRLRRNNET